MIKVTIELTENVIELLARMRISELTVLERRYADDLIERENVEPTMAEHDARDAGNEFYIQVKAAIDRVRADRKIA